MERKVTQVEFLMPKKLQTKRVAAYARVSSGKDAMLHSLSAQISYYSNLIQNHRDWMYCGVYADEAKTGTKDTRENFQRLIADCKAGKIDMVITKSISRFARNTVTLLQTIRELKALGVDVYFEEQNIHTMSAEGELLLTILASYAQEESRSASENQKWRIRKCYENGEDVNIRRMFGFRVLNGKLEPNPQTAPIVKEIFERVIAGESYGSIARDLNERGCQGSCNGEWSARGISGLISNERCMGDSLLQKKYRNNHLEKRSVRNHGELPMYYAEKTHEGIVDEETFMKAKAIYEGRRRKHLAPKTYTVFSGLIQCPKCGKSYRRVKNNGTVGYNCSTYINKGKQFCRGKKIPETVLMAETVAVLGLEEFDENAVKERIEKITVPEPNHLHFILKDGRTVERVWKDRSRAESWTEEMREAARQRNLERRENYGEDSAGYTAD